MKLTFLWSCLQTFLQKMWSFIYFLQKMVGRRGEEAVFGVIDSRDRPQSCFFRERREDEEEDFGQGFRNVVSKAQKSCNPSLLYLHIKFTFLMAFWLRFLITQLHNWMNLWSGSLTNLLKCRTARHRKVMLQWVEFSRRKDVAYFPLLSLFRREENRDGNTCNFNTLNNYWSTLISCH